jgi:hypothetical protein
MKEETNSNSKAGKPEDYDRVRTAGDAMASSAKKW